MCGTNEGFKTSINRRREKNEKPVKGVAYTCCLSESVRESSSLWRRVQGSFSLDAMKRKRVNMPASRLFSLIAKLLIRLVKRAHLIEN